MASTNNNSPDQHKYDHVVVVVLENHGYDEIIGPPDSEVANNAPYINGTLAQDGVVIANAYGEQHPSQPNYHWLFSGSNQGIYYDKHYWTILDKPPGPFFETPNLYTALEKKLTTKSNPNPTGFFAGFVESLPEATSEDYSAYYDTVGVYANRHVPWLAYKNINGGKPGAPMITKSFNKEFPPKNKQGEPDYNALPLLSFVIPNLVHDMHGYINRKGEYRNVSDPHNSMIAIKAGDNWLQTNLDGYAQWAKNHNSLLIITFDEDSSADWPLPSTLGGDGLFENPYGMTSPTLGFNPHDVYRTHISGPNKIAMIFYGANLSCSGYFDVPGKGVNNINLLRTIESFYKLPKSGSQTSLALTTGLTDGPIEGIFTFDN